MARPGAVTAAPRPPQSSGWLPRSCTQKWLDVNTFAPFVAPSAASNPEPASKRPSTSKTAPAKGVAGRGDVARRRESSVLPASHDQNAGSTGPGGVGGPAGAPPWAMAPSGLWPAGRGALPATPGTHGAQGGGIHKAYPGMVCGQNPHGEMARIAASSALRSWSTRPRRVRACTLSPRRPPDVPRWPTGPQPAPSVVSNATVCDPTCRRIQACRTSITPGRSSQRG